MQTVRCFVKGDGVSAQQEPDDNQAMWLQTDRKNAVTANIIADGKTYTKTIKLSPTRRTKVYLEKGRLKTTTEKIKKQQ